VLHFPCEIQKTSQKYIFVKISTVHILSNAMTSVFNPGHTLGACTCTSRTFVPAAFLACREEMPTLVVNPHHGFYAHAGTAGTAAFPTFEAGWWDDSAWLGVSREKGRLRAAAAAVFAAGVIAQCVFVVVHTLVRTSFKEFNLGSCRRRRCGGSLAIRASLELRCCCRS
jgi:hypothetical protein